MRGLASWRMIWMFLQTSIMLYPVIAINSPGDFTSIHLAKYLNKSVSPCSDFHRHVCSIGINASAYDKSQRYYHDLSNSREALSRNNLIMDDYFSAREEEACVFNKESYKTELRKRCGAVWKCYLDELYYFFNLYQIGTGNMTDKTLAYFVSYANRTKKNIPKTIDVTSNIVEHMMGDDRKTLNIIIYPYINLRRRLSIMSSVEHLGVDVVEKIYGLDKIRQSQKLMREAIAARFMETPWLNETNEFGLDRLSQYLHTLNDLRIIPDFGKLDYNLTMWRRIDRIITEKYFEYRKRSTGCARFDMILAFLTLTFDIATNKETGVTPMDFYRMSKGFVYNAFNLIPEHLIHIYAPTFYPFMSANSSDITQLGFAAVILGHEIFHSFINVTTNDNESFQKEAGCMISRFNRFCEVWAAGDCKSGQQTVNEDGPDLEGLRAAFDILRSKYTDEQLQEKEYEDLDITRQQAFFYAYALHKCGHGDENLLEHDDVHSASNIRLNGAVGLMPEFTAAFNCQKEDAEYSDETTSCYLFGPQSGTFVPSSSVESEDDNFEESSGAEPLEEEDNTTAQASI